MPSKKRALAALDQAKAEIAELAAHYHDLLVHLQRTCTHNVVYVHFTKTEHSHVEYRICPSCGKEERIVHDKSGPAIHRAFPVGQYGPFREIENHVLSNIRKRFSPYPDEQ